MLHQCALAPLAAAPPAAPPALHLEPEIAPPGFIESIRDGALALANAAPPSIGKLRAARQALEAVCVMSPLDAQAQSDLGVTWMRLEEHSMAWGAFGRALGLDPAHELAKPNRAELLAHLGERHPIVLANSLSPPRRPPYSREHTSRKLGAVAVPPDRWEERPPTLLSAALLAAVHSAIKARGGELKARGGETMASAGTSLLAHVGVSRDGSELRSERPGAIEALLVNISHVDANKHAVLYPVGTSHARASPHVLPLLTAARLLRSPGGRAGRASLEVPLAPPEWATALDALGATPPPFPEARKSELGRCARGHAIPWLELRERRRLRIYAAEGAGECLRTDEAGSAGWHLQLRGTVRWTLCPGGKGSAAAECGTAGIDTFDPSYVGCPSFRSATCFEARLGPGDALGIPGGWWYQTSAASAGAATLSSALLTPRNARRFGDFAARRCAQTRPGGRHEGSRRDEEAPLASAINTSALSAAACAAFLPCIAELQSLQPPAEAKPKPKPKPLPQAATTPKPGRGGAKAAPAGTPPLAPSASSPEADLAAKAHLASAPPTRPRARRPRRKPKAVAQ